MRITDTAAQTQGIALPARAHTSLSLSLCVWSVQRAHTSLSLTLSLVCSARGRERSSALIQLNTDIYVASLILHASIAEITAQLLSLSYVYLISSDDGAIIRIFFVQINILEGRAGVLMGRVSVTI